MFFSLPFSDNHDDYDNCPSFSKPSLDLPHALPAFWSPWGMLQGLSGGLSDAKNPSYAFSAFSGTQNSP